MKNSKILAIAASSLAMAFSAGASTITWVPVGDAGNAADNTGFGAVSYDYRIAKFEFTNRQYVDFLNSVDLNGTNTYKLYSVSMSTDARGGISLVPGNPVGSKYVVKPNFDSKPVNFVDWFDAARVANWMHNGASQGASTETGAYTLGGATTGSTVQINPGATVWIPTEDEWYKAAFYKGGSTNAGYWEYATQSESAPAFVSADAVGTGSAGAVGSFANYRSGADWNSVDGNVTSVGTNGGPSAYGAFDMGGNVREVVSTSPSTNAVWRGGSFVSGGGVGINATSGRATDAAVRAFNIHGFRLAAAAPEPGSTIPLLTLFGLGMAKSRRRKA